MSFVGIKNILCLKNIFIKTVNYFTANFLPNPMGHLCSNKHRKHYIYSIVLINLEASLRVSTIIEI